MKKPTGCLGCPLFDDGDGFVPDELVPGATVDVWLQNPGETEERKAQPAVGATGDDLNEKFLPEAGLTRGSDVNVRNVLRCRWRNPVSGVKTNNLPSGKVLEKAIQHCRAHDTPTGATVSVAAGALAWRMHGGPGTVTDWRGFPHPEKAVLATLHPADLYRNPKMGLAVKQDWAKVDLYKRGVWPEQVLPFDAVQNSQGVAQHVKAWCDKAAKAASFVVIDTEFTRDTRYLYCIGLGYPEMDRGLQLWLRNLDSVSRSVVRNSLLALIGRVPVVFQNAMADVPVLEANLGLRYTDYTRIEDTMLAHAVLWSEWPHDLGYLASIYGRYPKMKHLSQTDPQLYNWGDVLDTISVQLGVAGELSRDPQSKAVYTTQSLPLVPILLKRAKRGLRVHRDLVADAYKGLESRTRWATEFAKASVGYPINVGSEKQLKHYLYEWRGYPIQLDKQKKVSVGADAIAALRRLVGPPPDMEGEENDGLGLGLAQERVAYGADPVLEARVIYAAAHQEKTHFLAPLEGRERVYPSIKIHAQASGRWSITDPPLQQFPGYLQNLIGPDEGEVWCGWDWDQIELRVLAALSGDRPYLDAFSNDWDVHTLNACAIFGLPEPYAKKDPHGSPHDLAWRLTHQWNGKDDVRRLFAKRFVYRLNYGGDPRTAGDIPGASVLGLTGPKLVLASQRYLAAHPEMAAWRVQVAADARTARVSRTFLGRRRRLLGEGPGIVREAYNHPLQGAVSDILNLTTIAIADKCPYATLAYTVHDAAWWAVPTDRLEEFQRDAYPIITKEWQIGGQAVRIPAKWKEVRLPLSAE